MPRTFSRLCLVGLPLLGIACTGTIEERGPAGSDDPASPAGPSTPGNPAGPGVNPGTNPPGSPGVNPMTGEPPSTITAGQKCVSGKPGPRLLRRLTVEQLDNTVRDLFGNPGAPKSNVFNDPQVLGFTGDAAALLVRDLGSQQLMSYAEQVARWAVGAVAAQIAPCNQMTPACRTQFIETFGRRAFRQPLSPALVARYDKLFASGASFAEGLEATITAMLQSPYFLYRRELGEPDPGKPGLVRLTPWEVASNISYLITRSMPDDALLDAAAKGQLATREQIDAQVERLLQNPKHRETINTFVSEWLESKRVTDVLKEPNVFDFQDALRADMARETAAFVEEVVFTRKGTLSDLLKADFTFVNANLAKHYGISGVTGTQMTRVSVPHDKGILAHGSMMSGHGGTAFSSPTLRGKLVRTRLLCEPLPAPPDDVDTMIKVPENAKTTRQIFETHSQNVSCEGCHKMMDPIGYGFENYDLVGRHRTAENGVPVDASGEIVGHGIRFNGLGELTDHLAGNKEVRACMVRFMSYFAYGAAGWPDDGCTLDAINTEAAGSEWSIRGVLSAITHAPHFTTRVQ